MSFNKNIDQELMLTGEQWQILTQITKCLKTMAKWQRLLEGDKFVTASLVVLAIHSTRSNFKKTIAAASTLQPVKKLTEKLFKDFDDRNLCQRVLRGKSNTPAEQTLVTKTDTMECIRIISLRHCLIRAPRGCFQSSCPRISSNS
jgi:hypothetical protein